MTSAYDLAKKRPGTPFTFGVDQAAVAAELRRLAEMIEVERGNVPVDASAILTGPGHILFKSATVVTRASREDFTESTMILRFVEKRA